jgi:hypothetical protein
MPKRSYHVISNPNGGWSVKKDGSHRASKRFKTKSSAKEWAQNISRNQKVDLYIHDKFGRVIDKRSFRNDRKNDLKNQR